MARLGTLAAVVMCLPVLVAACRFTVPPRVMVVVMENQGYSQIIGNSALPYINSLADDYGLAMQSDACAHPSLPNYIDLVSGQCPASAADDGPPSSHTYGSQTVGDQIIAAGYSAKAYAESLPANPTRDAGLYVVHHDPWEYFPGTGVTVADASTMLSNLDGANAPDFVWYTPNLTDDGHTGQPIDTESNELADSEAFLSRFIPQVQATPWYTGGGQIIIEWDEALDSDTSGVNGASGGHVPTIVVSKYLAAAPKRFSGALTTAGVLNTIEHLYQLPFLGGASNADNGNMYPLMYW